ncbi:MAG: hypothetical protein U0802_02850 [Candidatus Binatia bacterium]
MPGPPVRVANPINRDEPEMRRSLLPGLVTTWRTNRNQGARVWRRSRSAGFGSRTARAKRGACPASWSGNCHGAGLGGVAAAGFADAKGVVEPLLERLRVLDRVRFEPTDARRSTGKSAALRCEGADGRCCRRRPS